MPVAGVVPKLGRTQTSPAGVPVVEHPPPDDVVPDALDAGSKLAQLTPKNGVDDPLTLNLLTCKEVINPIPRPNVILVTENIGRREHWLPVHQEAGTTTDCRVNVESTEFRVHVRSISAQVADPLEVTPQRVSSTGPTETRAIFIRNAERNEVQPEDVVLVLHVDGSCRMEVKRQESEGP